MRKVRMTLEFTLDEDMMNWLQDFDTGIPVAEWDDIGICDVFTDSLDLIVEDCVPYEVTADIVSD